MLTYMLYEAYSNVYIAALRWIAPIIAIVLLFRCIRPLLTFRKDPEIWGWLHVSNGKKVSITHWENIIGRSKRSDIVIDFPTISKTHCVLTRYDDGSWSVSDADSKSGVFVNDRKIDIHALEPEDVITIGCVELTVQPISKKQEKKLSQLRVKQYSAFVSFGNVMLLTVFQMLCCIAYLLADAGNAEHILLGFGGIVVLQWILLLFYLLIKRTAFEVETLAFFLCTLGMIVIAAVKPQEALKQLSAIGIGLVTFLGIGWSLRKTDRTKKCRYIAAVAGIGLLVITLLFGQEYYGAKNWLVFGSLSIQPSELSKVCFVYVGAASMDRIVTKRNLFFFIAYAIVICGCLALMNDFGTALIFFCAFLITAYMRSGNMGTIALACTSLGFAGVVALKIAPHALRRFSSWRHIWEVPLDGGYQQTRALMCMASGGFLGLGAGNGWLKKVFAADSDIAIATLCEEWGLAMVIMAILVIITFAIFCIRSGAIGRSSLFTIGACTAVSIFLVQVILNALGTVDIIPLTGVTFPFLSNGGSSMICSWGLLAYIKAADTRQNASFAVRLMSSGGASNE